MTTDRLFNGTSLLPLCRLSAMPDEVGVVPFDPCVELLNLCLPEKRCECGIGANSVKKMPRFERRTQVLHFTAVEEP